MTDAYLRSLRIFCCGILRCLSVSTSRTMGAPKPSTAQRVSRAGLPLGMGGGRWRLELVVRQKAMKITSICISKMLVITVLPCSGSTDDGNSRSVISYRPVSSHSKVYTSMSRTRPRDASACLSTPRTAYTAKRVTSRTLSRI